MKRLAHLLTILLITGLFLKVSTAVFADAPSSFSLYSDAFGQDESEDSNTGSSILEPADSINSDDVASIGREQESDSVDGNSDTALKLNDDLVPAIDRLASDHKYDLVDGIYIIRSSKDRWKNFDVSGGSSNNGANIQLYTHNGSIAQRWKVSHYGGYVVFVNAGSGKVLDVSRGSATAGANIQQYEWNASKAQLWVAVSSVDGVKLVSALDQNLVIDLYGGNTSNGSNIQLYSDNGTAAQKWVFESLAENGQSPVKELAERYRGTLPDGDYVLSSGVGNRQVLDAAGGSVLNGTNVQTYTSNMTGAQKWHVSNLDNGFISITNVKAGKPLDVSGGSIALGANVQLYSNNSSLAQMWIAVPMSNSNGRISVELHSALLADLVLDVSGGSSQSGSNVQLYASNGSSAQRFTFVPCSPDVPSCSDMFGDGWYLLSSISNLNSVLDISSASLSDGANVQIWNANNTLAQLFKFEYVDGYYVIKNAKTDKVLDVAGGNLIAPTNVQQWSYSKGCANQLWSITTNDDGSYSFINKATGLVLDLSGGSTSRGANVQAYISNGSAAQRFKVSKVYTLIPSGIVSIYASSNHSKCLDVAGGSHGESANVQIYNSNGSLAQKWLASVVDEAAGTYSFESLCSGKMLASAENGNVCQTSTDHGDQRSLWTPFISNGAVSLKNVATGRVLDIAGGNLANGANIQVYETNGTAAQSFSFENVSPLNDGVYEIASSSSSNYRLDVSGGSFSDGANIQWYSSNGSGAQVWTIKNMGGDIYSIVNADTGKSLDITNSVIAPSTNIQQWSQNGSAAQIWKIEYRHNGSFEIRPASNGGLAVGSNRDATNGANLELVLAGSATSAVTFNPTTYYSGAVLGVSRASLVRWLSSHQYDGYYIGTRYSTGLSVDTCIYPNGARRWDGFAGMNCGGFVAHVYSSAGGNVWPINSTNSHSPWSGGPGRGGYVNAWRWYGYAVDTGHVAYTFNSVSDLLRSGVARKGDLIFFKANPRYDCHIGFFWGDSPSDNKLWSSYSPANTISPIFNSDDPYEIDQQVVLIR